MKAVFRFFAERHLLANLLTIMVVLIGLFSAARINRSEYPKVELGYMYVVTVYPGASPEDVELNVTNKIENELKGITGIKTLSSNSRENVSFVQIELDTDMPDQEKIKDEVREAVARVTDLPDEVKDAPQISEEKSTLWPIIEVGITGDVPYAELREYARQFEKKLKEIPGVAQVHRHGYRDREVRIEVSPDKMMKYQVSLNEVINAIRMRNIRASGGALESYTSERNVVTLAQFRDPQEVGDVIVRSTSSGAVIRVKDLATITDDFEEEQQLRRINGYTAISFEIVKSEQGDIVRTVNAVNELIEQEQTYLPDAVKFIYAEDRSEAVRSRFGIVMSNGALGLILVLFVLAAFLNIRSSFWVAMGIPFTMLGVIFLLPLFDVDLDSVTLCSMILVLGIVVDDAIVISENIFQRRARGESPIQAAVNGVHEVYLPVLTTVATTILAFLPMFFMKGMLGKFVYVVPLTIILALSTSLFEALFILPTHLIPGLQKKGTDKSRNFGRTWFNPIRNAFEKLAFRLLKLRYVWVAVAVVFLAVSLWYGATFMKFILFPSQAANAFYAYIELPTGSSLEATLDKVQEIEAIVGTLPEEELQSYYFQIGSSSRSNTAVMVVNLTPYATRDRIADEIVEDLRARTEAVSGIEQIAFAVESGGPPTGSPIEIRVIGANDTVRTQLVDDIVAFLNTIDGVKDVDRTDKGGKEEVIINVNHERLSRYSLTVADVAQNVRIAYDGETVTSVRYGEDDVDFRVILSEEYRQQVSYMKQLRIPNQRGELIALDEVAELEIITSPTQIRHHEGERVVRITGDVLQDQITPVEVMTAVQGRFNVYTDYPGMRIDIGGEAEESRKAMIDLFITFGIAAVGIYFLLMLLFNSVTQPLMVIMAIPFGISGVVLTFAMHGQPFSFLGMLGVIGMAGVVVNDSLVMVDHLNGLRRQASATLAADVSFANPQQFIKLVAKGAANRLRPIMLTSFTTIAGLLPLAYGLGGQDMYMSPMALSLGYGLLFATPLTLVLVPSFYVIAYDIERLLKRVRSREYNVSYPTSQPEMLPEA